MTTDRELLEGAARAAGLKIVDKSPPISLYVHSDGCCGGAHWNPLADDGDALRLAVKLKLDVLWAEHEKSVVVCNDSSNNEPVTEKVRFTIDPCAATRRAIVRAAAEVGKAMK